MSYVYFIQQGVDGPIKIGVADNPVERLRLLQVGNPEQLYIRALISNAGYLEEANLHRLFSDGRIRGEWFRAETPGLAGAIRTLEYQEFFPDDAFILCQRCDERPIAAGRRKYCEVCS